MLQRTLSRPSTFRTAFSKADIATRSLTVRKVALISMITAPAFDHKQVFASGCFGASKFCTPALFDGLLNHAEHWVRVRKLVKQLTVQSRWICRRRRQLERKMAELYIPERDHLWLRHGLRDCPQVRPGYGPRRCLRPEWLSLVRPVWQRLDAVLSAVNPEKLMCDCIDAPQGACPRLWGRRD